MAKVKITGHASGSGVITVTAPNTSTDRTITLPDATATIATTTDVAARLPSIVDGGNATAMTIDANEQVGIGVTSPTTSLHLKDNVTGANTKLTVERSALSYTGEYAASHCGSVTNNEFDLNTNNTLSLRLTADGRGLSQFTAKAWINYTGVSTTAIRDSHNVSSISDDSPGRTTINFSNNMANGNYATVASHNAYHIYASWSNGADIMPWDPLVGSVKIVTGINNGYVDSAYVSAVIFGD